MRPTESLCKYNGMKQLDKTDTYEPSDSHTSLTIEIDPDPVHDYTQSSSSKEGRMRPAASMTIDLDSKQTELSLSQEDSLSLKQPSPDTLNHLLFHSNSQLFNNYHKDNASNQFISGYMDFCKLSALLNDILCNKVKAKQNFIECLDSEWNKYQTFTQKTALKISQYIPQKSVMITILQFNEFVWLNQQCLADIITEYDSISPNNTKLSDIWEWKLEWKPHKILFESIKQISNLYHDEMVINIENDAKGINNYEFDRKCTKYWVAHENVFQVIGQIIQHLPIYVYGQKSDSLQVYQKISSVYFDNDDFKSYHERMAKEEGARSVRIRWYDDNQPRNKSDKVFFERKIHHCASITDEPSLKQRFKIKNSKIIPFIKGTMKRDTPLKQEIYDFIKTFQLKPKTRTVCKRISFQFDHTNDLRISLDLNLTFVKEKSDLLDNDEWFTSHRDVYDNDVVRFSFDVLEIKLAGEYVDNPPLWIQDMMDSELLIDCYKFSKFGQSVNEFYANCIHFVPKWIDENQQMFDFSDKPVQKPRKMVENNKKNDNNEDKCCVPLMVKRNREKSKEKSGRKTKPVNPKVYFSNERTFLGWFQAAVFIGGSGLTINSIDRKDPAGYLLIAVAVAVLLWAIVTYYRRNWKLLQGKMNGLHDFYGPSILVSVILFVFVYSLINGNNQL